MKFLDFIFDNPEYFNKLLKKSHNHKNQKINKLMQKHVSNKTDKIVSYKMVFIKFFILNLFCLLSGLIIYQLLSHYHSTLYSFLQTKITNIKELILFLIGFKLIIILICCFYKLSLYYWNCFLPIALHLMVILVGFLYAALFCFYRFYGKQYLDFPLFIQYLIPLVPLISLLITILILVFITVLYKINKIKVYPGFIKVLKIFFLISFIGEIICFSLYCYHNYFSNFFFLIILIFLSLITFIIGILRWVYVLHQLDNFAKNKVLAKECEWILVNFLWLSSMEVFCSIFELFIYVITYLGNIKNDKR